MGTASLAGVVHDDIGRPLRRATVVINGDMRLQRSTVTDDQGGFRFSNLPAGRFTITASKPAYPSMAYGAKRPNRPGAGVLLAAGQQVTGIVVTLPRGAVITGTVFDEHGQPMPGVPVMPWEVRTALSGEQTLDFPSTSGGEATATDDQGQFRFYGLAPGEYTVGTAWYYSGVEGNVRIPTDAEIRAAFLAQSTKSDAPGAGVGPGRTVMSRAPEATHNYSKVFHPSTVDPMEATTVQLKAGDERGGMNIHMQFRPMSRIDVTLSGPADVPPARLTITRASKVQALNSSSVTSIPVNGRVESSSLSPDRYTIRVQSQPVAGRPAMWALGEATLVGAEPVTVALELQPAMTATGRVVLESIAGTPPPPPGSINVSFAGVTPGTWASLPAVPVDGSGSFTRDGLFPASFRVTATGSGLKGWTVKTVTVDGHDVTDLPIEIRPGDSPTFVITLTDQIAELSGHVLDPSNRPSADYFVVVLPADRAYWTPLSRRIASVRPDMQGRYAFRSLPAGEYRLAATTDLVSNDLQQVGQLEALAAQSLPVTIGAGERKVVDIRVAGR